MRKNSYRVIIIFICIVTLAASFYGGRLYQWATTAEFKTTKDYNEIVVEENDIADYTVFIEIPERYSALEQIEESVRKTISLYMQANHLKLSVGSHRFNRTDGTLEKYLKEEFKFEPIE